MKKILFVTGLVLGMTFSGIAQSESKKLEVVDKQEVKAIKTVENAEADAISDAKSLANVINLNDATVQAFYKLFVTKYTVIYNSEISDERKSLMRSEVAEKIKATLNSSQFSQLERNKDLYTRLIN